MHNNGQNGAHCDLFIIIYINGNMEQQLRLAFMSKRRSQTDPNNAYRGKTGRIKKAISSVYLFSMLLVVVMRTTESFGMSSLLAPIIIIIILSCVSSNIPHHSVDAQQQLLSLIYGKYIFIYLPCGHTHTHKLTRTTSKYLATTTTEFALQQIEITMHQIFHSISIISSSSSSSSPQLCSVQFLSFEIITIFCVIIIIFIRNYLCIFDEIDIINILYTYINILF